VTSPTLASLTPSLPSGGSATFGSQEGRAPIRQRLMAMLFLTALLHAIVILGLTFKSGLAARSKDSPTLEVLLVTNDLPEARTNPHATYLAQRTQLGSGNADAAAQTASPAAHAPPAGHEGAAGRQASDRSTAGENPLLASTGASADVRYFAAQSTTAPGQRALPAIEADTGSEDASGRGDADQLTLRGPRRGELWISPDTREALLAPYVAAWRRKVERVGTLNFPTVARSGLSGNPVLEVAISADGRLVLARVQRSSGDPALDQAALDILRLASPFDPFSPALAARYRVLRFAYQWEFVGGQVHPGAVTASSDTADGP
jgi:periplasmic protein TonB